LIDFGPKYFRILFSNEDIYDNDEKKKTICDYDFAENFYSKKVTNSKFSLIQEEILFIGNAFIAPHFTDRNKMQLLKFILQNIKACQTSKDLYVRVQKLTTLLAIALSIITKIYTEAIEKSEKVETEILDVFREICEASWIYTGNSARVACALIYSMIFRLGKSTSFSEVLLK
jgi:hypothetical protein